MEREKVVEKNKKVAAAVAVKKTKNIKKDFLEEKKADHQVVIERKEFIKDHHLSLQVIDKEKFQAEL